MIIVFTGNGKGKTTSALGQMVRVLGRGKKALMIQFIKGPWRSGEDDFAEKFGITEDTFKIVKAGLGFVGILGDKLPKEAHAQAARRALELFAEEQKNDWHLMILDEVNVAISLGLIPAGDVLQTIKGFPEDRILMLTGRNAPPELVEAADLVTEMREVKHPYAKGQKAKISVEF